MAGWVLSECGIRPLPPVFSRPRTGLIPNTRTHIPNQSKIGYLHANKKVTDLRLCAPAGFSRERKWVLNVSAPSKVVSVDGEERRERINGVSGVEDDVDFDPGAPPPFKLAQIRAAIPKHCWVKDPWKSMSYVVRDVAVVFGLAVGAAYLNKWLVWPLYWATQSTMFWALFVLGHDF